jgi:hypothetical protein
MFKVVLLYSDGITSFATIEICRNKSGFINLEGRSKTASHWLSPIFKVVSQDFDRILLPVAIKMSTS